MMNTTTLPYQPIQISGEDAERFLQGLLTADVQQVKSGYCQLTALCNRQGRIVASFFLAQSAEGFWLFIPTTNTQEVISLFKKHVLRSKVVFHNRSEAYQICAANSTILGTTALSNCFKVLQLPASTLCLVNSDLVSKHTEDYLLSQIFNERLIEHGIVIIDNQNSGLFTPHHLNYPKLKAVSLEKGCFLGQEVIARMHYRGKLKEKLMLFELSTPAQTDFQFEKNSEVNTTATQQPFGQLVDVCERVGSQTWLALILVKLPYSGEGPIEAGVGEQSIVLNPVQEISS